MTRLAVNPRQRSGRGASGRDPGGAPRGPAWLVIAAVWTAACGAPGGTAAQPARPTPAAQQGGSSAATPRSGLLRIRHLDVGQGDATLLTTPEGRRVLIDAGPDQHAVADMLWGEGVDTLDLLVTSHNHADHIGGAPEVFFAYPVRAYLENGVPAATAVYDRTLAAAEREPGLRALQATARTVTVGSVGLRVLPPPHEDDTQNDNSVGVVVEYGAFRALFTGDSERAELARWLAGSGVPRATLVKAAHHGSANGVTPAWAAATRPAVVVISVGADNKYGHPAPSVERLWADGGARVYRTDRDGSVEVDATADGRFTVRTHVAARPGRTSVGTRAAGGPR